MSASEWEKEIPFNSNFRVVHEVVGTLYIFQRRSSISRLIFLVVPSHNGGLDQIMLASREGISFLWYDDSAKKWEFETLGTGMPPNSR